MTNPAEAPYGEFEQINGAVANTLLQHITHPEPDNPYEADRKRMRLPVNESLSVVTGTVHEPPRYTYLVEMQGYYTPSHYWKQPVRRVLFWRRDMPA